MAQEFRQVDEHGFPIPPRFTELKRTDDESLPKAKISLRAKRLSILAILVLVIIPIVFGPQLLSSGREMLANWFLTRAQHKALESDLAGALADLDTAVDWNPDNWQLYRQRAEVRKQIPELDVIL